MIWETVGGAFLSAFLQVLFDRLSSRQCIDFFRRRKFDEALLQRLKATLLTINAVLSDAEEKQIANSYVKEWVDELKDAAYHAEDLLDEIATLQCSVDAADNNNQARGNNKSTLNAISNGLEKMTSRLEHLAKQKDILGLKASPFRKPSPRLPTTSLVDEFEVFGRDDDRDQITKMLLPRSINRNVNGNDVPVIAIIGIGGVGKTTLAQLLYNDLRVKKHFSIRSWTYVSEEFDVFKVSKAILESVTSRLCNITDLNVIQVRIKERLTRKRFLLVLDDVWNENFMKWDLLRSSFKAAANGSRIIVTTRSQGVASTMHAVFTHHLQQLSEEDCSSVFAKQFKNENTHLQPNLKIIGEEIVKKCKGLPLAAKTLGSLLHSKTEAHDWYRILNSKIWDLPSDKSIVLPSLRLSYYYLPSHLKQCFAYCSIFPRGYVFEKEKLILLWMAEGFLQKTEEGHEYFNELLSRSFFQQSSVDGVHFIMHDLVNELAQFASGEFCFKLERDGPLDISEKARHFSYVRDQLDVPEKFEALHEVKFLRTFLPLSLSSNPGRSNYFSKMVIEQLSKLRCLRVLSLSHYRITSLPDVFGNLQHLRYLDLSCTEIIRLPKSVCSLHSLRTLILSNCPNLAELPANTRNLIKLEYLDVTGTKLREMPPQFGRLKRLQTLTTFVVGKSSDSSICELGGLLHLRGKLSILQLQDVRDASAAENAKLKEKNNIKELVFRWDRNVHDLQLEDVLEKLCPHKNTERLTIEKYNGKNFPGWLGDITFSNMVFLRLSDCKNCSSLSLLGQLSSLKELCIAKMERLESIGPEFYGFGPSSINPFRLLCSLRFEDMPNWKHWSSVQVEGGEFPSLQELHIRKCRKLIGNLPIYLPSLKLLHIEECRDLDFLFEDTMLYTELQKLIIKSSCNSLTNFPLGFFNKLEYLHIWDCKYLKFMEVSEDLHVQQLRFLKKLEVYHCDNLEFFTGKGLLTPNMTHFSVSSCKSLKSMPERMHELLTSLQELHLSSCPELKSFPSDGLPPNLHSLSIKNCAHLYPQREWGLNKMASLTYLEIIGGCRNVKSFPEEGLLPVSLTSLQVSDLPVLEVLDLKGLQFLSCLKRLKINNCVSLHCLSEGKLPSSLSFLNISECSLLTARCQKEQGEDWPKICHVRNIHIEN